MEIDFIYFQKIQNIMGGNNKIYNNVCMKHGARQLI